MPFTPLAVVVAQVVVAAPFYIQTAAAGFRRVDEGMLLVARTLGATPERARAPRGSAYVVNSICRQCHTAHSTRYPNAASVDNSGEARDLMQGACASQIRCVDCHNPHLPGPTVGAAPDREEHIEACLGCHDQYRQAGPAEAHTGHAASSGVTCLDCHMP